MAGEYQVDVLGRVPIDPALAAACDAGTFENELPEGLLPEAVAKIRAVPAHEGDADDADDAGASA